MSWLSLASAVVQLALSIARMVERRRAEEAGAAKVLAAELQGALDAVRKAQDARRAVADDLRKHPDRLRDDDGFRRD